MFQDNTSSPACSARINPLSSCLTVGYGLFSIRDKSGMYPTNFKAKREKGVGTPFPRVPASLHPCF